MNRKEWLDISFCLEDHHVIFYKIWELGKPKFSTEVDTACVVFDKTGKSLSFLFNQNYWCELPFYDKLFIICHECLHVILNHGVRIKDSKKLMSCNICLDVVVNEMLIKFYGFEKNKLKNFDDYCWVENIFDKETKKDESFEYYFSLFKDFYKDGLPLKDTVDNHDTLNFNSKDLIKQSLESVSVEERASLKSLGKHLNYFIEEDFFKTKKRKWESVIKRYQNNFIEDYNWHKEDRRLTSLNKELCLPFESQIESFVKIDILFFLDTSMSCWHLKDRFFKAAMSMPKNIFNVKMFCFDNQVFEITSKLLKGGRGTSYSILEDKVSSLSKYPEAIFVITDGLGNEINPLHPKRWYWFLTNNKTMFIPKESHVYNLEEFE